MAILEYQVQYFYGDNIRFMLLGLETDCQICMCFRFAIASDIDIRLMRV
jgi:hypothetical protein